LKLARVPDRSEVNAWSRLLAQRREHGDALLDLTAADASPIAAATGVPAVWRTDTLHAPDPRGSHRAREAVAAYYADRGAALDPDDVVLTASTSEAYAHLFRVLGEPGAIFAAPQPGYPLFEPLAQAEAVRITNWRLDYDGGWHLDPSSLDGPDPRGVIVVQPNHPTGTWLAPADLERIESWCGFRKVWHLISGYYGPFAEGTPVRFGTLEVPGTIRRAA
jgi:alanine-synthesizing transaminase